MIPQKTPAKRKYAVYMPPDLSTEIRHQAVDAGTTFSNRCVLLMRLGLDALARQPASRATKIQSA